MEGGATTPNPSSSCLYHEALLSHVARSRGKISRTSTRAVKRPTHMGASQLIEQVRACGEGAVKTPAPRTLRAMRNFAIKKSPPHGLNHARGGYPHAFMGVGLRPETGHCEPTQRAASYLAMRDGLSPIHVMERSFAPLPLYTDSGAPMIRAMLQTVTAAISASTSSV